MSEEIRIEEDGILVYYTVDDDGFPHVTCVYENSGSWFVPREWYGDKSPDEIIIGLRLLRDRNMAVCSRCGGVFEKKDIAFNHFAGHYCGLCAEEYKAANNTECRICGAPRWRCTC